MDSCLECEVHFSPLYSNLGAWQTELLGNSVYMASEFVCASKFPVHILCQPIIKSLPKKWSKLFSIQCLIVFVLFLLLFFLFTDEIYGITINVNAFGRIVIN